MSLTRFAVRQVVLMNLLFVVLIVAGAVILKRLPIDVYPETSLDIGQITTLWVGASSEEVERLVTRKIEEEIEDLGGCDRITSISQPDVSVITVKFQEDISRAAFEAAFDELRTRLDRVSELPEGVEEPRLERLTTNEALPLMQLGVVDEGGVGEAVLRRIAHDLKDELRTLPGIAKIGMIGQRDREVHVLVDKHALEQHGLSLRQVADVLKTNNLNLPAGHLPIGETEITLRSIGEAHEPEELGNVCIVRSTTGAHVRLRDIATIEEGFERAIWSARVNGKPSIMLKVVKESDANSLTVRDVVDECIDSFLAGLDISGVDVEIQADSTAIIASRLAVLKNNMLVGLALILATLFFFIGLRNALLAVIGIPFAFLCAVIFMDVIGVSLNAVSVFSLVLVSGMIVDDAIVVLENIYHHVQTGLPVKEAVIRGTDEVIWPVVTSTMTTVMAFLPLLLMAGVLGRFFAIVPKTVTVALVASLFECLIILPVHYLDWGPRGRKRRANSDSGAATDTATETVALHAADTAPVGGFRGWALDVYEKTLRQVVAYRYVGPVLLIAFVFFAVQAERTLTSELFPKDFPTFAVAYDTRPGSSLATTTQAVADLAPIIEEFKPLKVVRSASLVGVQITEDGQQVVRTDVAMTYLDVASGSSLVKDPVRVMNEVRAALNGYLASHPDSPIESMRFWSLKDGPPVGKPVAIRIEHPDYDEARIIAEQIEERLRGMPGVYDVNDNLQIGNRELVLRIDDERASELGVTFLDAATAYRGARDGLHVGVFKDTVHDDDLDIVVRYAETHVESLDQLPDIDVISSTTGAKAKLHQVANLEFNRTYTNRYHYDGKRAVEVTADVDPDITDAKLVNEIIRDEFAHLADGDDRLAIFAGGQFAETQESFASLRSSAIVALLLMYLILATQFRSYLQPIVVLTAVVFGVLGMVVGLVLHGYPFSVVTGIAMVGLCGVVVNDALVLIDFINQRHRAGFDLVTAVCSGCRRRLRPIILTTVTTVVGLAPMALGVGGYSKIWSPFAMSMCWGLLFSTVLTLLVVPALYVMMVDITNHVHRMTGRPSTTQGSVDGPASRSTALAP